MAKIDTYKYYTCPRFKVRATMKSNGSRTQRTLIKSVDADKVDSTIAALTTLQELNGFYVVGRGLGFVKMAAQATSETIEFQVISY